MLKILDFNYNQIGICTNYLNPKRVSKLDKGDKELSFVIPSGADDNNFIKEQYFIDYDNDRYCVKEIKENAEGIGYLCQLDIEGLLGEVYELIVGVNDDIPTLFKRIDLTTSGWTIECDPNFKKRRTINLEYFDLWNLITEVMKVYGCEIKIDSISRVVYFTEQVGNNNNAYFIEGLNIDETSIEIVSDSYDLYTRIIPLGVGKVDISTVNNGKIYLDNFQYMNKVKTFYWKDERYTDLEQLKEDATIRLNEISKPRNTINVTLKNLANITGEYEFLRIGVGDTITIVAKGLREAYRVSELTEYPHKPFEDSVVLANTNANLSSYLQDRENDISKLDLSFEKITVETGLISSKVQKVEVDVAEQEIRINSAEEKITPEAITHTVTSSNEYINDMGERVTVTQMESEIKQTATDINLSVKNSGLSNLMRNGSFEKGLNYWSINGSPETNTEQTWNNYNGKTLYMYTATSSNGIYQRIKTVVGKKYCFSFVGRIDVPAKNFDTMIGIEDIKVISLKDKYSFSNYNFVFTATKTEHVVVLYGKAGAGFYIDDVMVVEGEYSKTWLPHTEEIYSSNVKLDSQSFEVAFSNGTKMLCDIDTPLTLVDGNTQYQYHALSSSGTSVAGGDLPQRVTIQLPNIFKGKDFSVNLSTKSTRYTPHTYGDVIGALYINLVARDITNATFTVEANWTSYSIQQAIELQRELEFIYVCIA